MKSDEMSLKELILKIQEFWLYLIAKWKVIVLAGIIGGLIGLTYAYSKKFLYIAELSFGLDEGQPGMGMSGAYSGLASMAGIDLGGGGGGMFAGENLIALMKSRSIVEKTLLTSIDQRGKKETLIEFYISTLGIRENWRKDKMLKDIEFLPSDDRSKYSRTKDSVLLGICSGIISENLIVSKKDKKVGIITLTVKSGDELFSKYFAETLINVVSEVYIDTKTRKSADNLAILQHQVDSVRTVLNSSIRGVAASVDVNPNANPVFQRLKVPSQTRSIDVQTSTAVLQQLMPNLELAKITLRKETPLIQIIDKPILPLQKEKMGKAKGLILGGFFAGVITIFFLLIRRIINNIVSDETR